MLRALANLSLIASIFVALVACGSVQVYPVHAGEAMGALGRGQQTQATADIAAMASGLPSISIPLPVGRDGQILHNALRDQIAPTGLAPNPQYELIVQSFAVTEQGIEAQVGTTQTLTRHLVTIGYRVNRIQDDGQRVLAFADTLSVTDDYNAPDVNSFYVVDPRTQSARRRAIDRAAQVLAMALKRQFARARYDARFGNR